MLLLLLACGTEPDTDKASAPEETTDSSVDTSSGCVPETERCNWRDDDCDGLVDEEGGLGWYPDADGDGYGDEDAAATEACERPDGYVRSHMDCDDAEAGVSPGATEVCGTSVDENCDGALNNYESIGCTTYYRDEDGDGLGSDDTQCWCEPSGYYDTLVTGDCDDEDPIRTTDCSLPGSVVILTDERTMPLRAAADVDGDGRVDLAVRGSAADALVTIPTSGSPSLAESTIVTVPYSGRTTSRSGYETSGDIDGDGLAEIVTVDIVEEEALDTGSADESTATVSLYHGPAAVTAGAAGAAFQAGPYNTSWDWLLAPARVVTDVDGDGLDDVLFATNSNGAWLLPPEATGEVELDSLTPFIAHEVYDVSRCDLTGDGLDELVAVSYRSTTVYETPQPRDAALQESDGQQLELPTSWWHATGDLNGDGHVDAILAVDLSEADVYLGPLLGEAAPSAWSTLPSEGNAPYFITSLAIADVTGDGDEDVVYALADEPAVYGGLFVFEHLAGGTMTAADASSRYAGDSLGDGFGYGLVALPDRDGDGAEDVAVGSDVGVYVFPML